MYYQQRNQFCNLTDHKGLPIIHINTDIHNRDKRQEQVSRITDYTIVKGSIQHKDSEPSSHMAQHPNIYDLQTVTNNYLSVHSADMTLGGRPNLSLVG